MYLNKKLLHLAELSKLNVSNQNDMLEAIDEIVSLIAHLKTIDTDNVEPLCHPLETLQPLRNDEVTFCNFSEQLKKTTTDKFRNGFFITPSSIQSKP